MAKNDVRRRRFEWSQVRVAILVLFGLAFLALGVYQIGAIFNVFADRYTLVSLVPNVAGLREGAPVTLAGQRVGQVTEINFIPVDEKSDSNNVIVHLSIDRSIAPQVREDSEGFLRAEGLLGDKYLDIAPGSAEAAPLQPGDTLLVGDAVDLDAVLARTAETLDSAQIIMREWTALTRSVSRGEGTLGSLLTDEQLYDDMLAATRQLERTFAAVNRGDGTLGRLARDPALYERLEGAAVTLDSLGSEMLHGEGTFGRLVREDSVYRSLLATAGSADSALTSLSTVLEGINEGEGTLGRLTQDPELYEALLQSVVDLQTVIRAIREDPSLLRPTVDIF